MLSAYHTLHILPRICLLFLNDEFFYYCHLKEYAISDSSCSSFHDTL